MPFRSAAWRWLLVSAFFWFNTPAGSAQTAPHGYDFLTVTTLESSAKSLSKILITPAFQGKVELPLEDFGGMSVDKNLDKLQRNTQLINQQLGDLTAAGWDLVEVHVVPVGVSSTTRYLFRKPRP